MLTFIRTLIGAFVCLSLAVDLYAQSPSPNRPRQRSADRSPTSEATDSKGKESEKKEEKKPVTAIVGGDIVTVTSGTIRNGTVLIQDGKILKLGRDVEVPSDATVIDAKGRTITPGFVAISMSGVGLSGAPPGGSESNQNQSRLRDELNPFDRNIQLTLSAGITSGCVQVRAGGGGRGRRDPAEGYEYDERFMGFDPVESELEGMRDPVERAFGELVRLCPCCSLPILPTEPITDPAPTEIVPQKSSVIKMSYGKLEGMFVKETAFLELNAGALTGVTNQAAWRDQISKARKYLEDQAKHEQATREGKKSPPPRKPVSDEVLSLVKGEIAMRIPGNRVSEIRDLIQLAKELKYRLVIAGALEAWVHPNELAEAGVEVTITPRIRREARFGEEETSGSWIELPRVLESAGVPFAVDALSPSVSLGGLAGRDLMSLPLEAAFAVRGGASEARALRAITIIPATMIGLQDRIGSLEVGKDADLLILSGPPLDYRTYVEKAIVNGNPVYNRSADKLLPLEDAQSE
jgi:imidazolonepropionase-like amidohydrolase